MATPSYTATRDADGALVIHDVPIFCECSRFEHAFDVDWITKAVERAKRAEAEGYLPPLHVRHHGGDALKERDVRAAGFFRITRAAPITFKGGRRVAIFADLVVTDPGISFDILAKRLPYRSVEILDVENPAIDSLALLDHEPPYLELPMLMVGQVDESAAVDAGRGPLVASATFRNPWLARERTGDGPVLACFTRGRSAHLIYDDDETEDSTMPTPLKLAKDEAPADKGEKDTKPKDGEKMADGEGGVDVKGVCKAIESGSISIADMDAILAAIQAQRGAKTEQPEAEAAPAPAAVPGAESMSKDTPDTKTAEQLARLAGENAALKARIDQREAAEKRRDDVAVAMQRLAGRPLGANVEQELHDFHQKFGAQAFGSYVDQMVKTFAAVPSKDGAAAANFAAQNGISAGTSKVAEAYQAHGADAVKNAAQFAREWAELNRRGHIRMSEERYVAVSMARTGIQLTK